MVASPIAIADLHAGDRMSRDEFLSQWELIPELKRAELIDGVVYLPAPVSEPHSDYEQLFNRWLSYYADRVDGLKVMPQPTVLLGDSSPQPDLVLARVNGTSKSGSKYREGPPELVVEICYSSRAYDLGPKLDLYRRSGVSEYIAVLLREQRVEWRTLKGGRYYPIVPHDGLLKSRVFPGLWLDSKGIFPPDRRRLFAGIDLGIRD